MSDTLDTTLSERFSAQADLLPGPDFADVRRRAHADVAVRNERRWFGRRRRLVVVALAASLAVTGGAGALAYQYLGPSPGFTAGLSAFDRLPRADWPASMERRGLERAAASIGMSTSAAEQQTRLLRSGLTQGDLYAFRGENGTVCVFLTGHFGDCLGEETAAREPGVLAKISPGYPHESPAVVAIVADNVSAVALVVNGRRSELEIVNNSVYRDLGELAPTDTVSLEAAYADGTTKSFQLRPLRLPG